MFCLVLLVASALLQAKLFVADPSELQVIKLHVSSEIYSRFATTNVTSGVLNTGKGAQEAVFKVQLPNSAFISYFQMTIENDVIVGEVKDKAAAKKQYEAAKAKGQSSGLVAKSARETNKFDISINVEPRKTVHFTLVYQELLQRVQGAYKHVININTGQIVDNFLISVSITERKPLSLLKVPPMDAKLSDKSNKLLLASDSSNNYHIEQYTYGELHKAQITYKPRPKEQSVYSTKGLDGLQMVVLYDVERDFSAGEVEVVNGYFVHFIAPQGNQLPIGNKHVVFILDISGSMSGIRIAQMRSSMLVFLDALQPADMFNIITFATNVHVKYSESRRASPEAVSEAKAFVDTLQATSYTNVYEALNAGLRVLKQHHGDILQSVLIFLTDGMPTINVTNPADIVSGVNSWNKQTQFSIHSISFGDGADYDLLRTISAQNNGVARKVYEDSDANLQLVGFFDEVCSPMLTNLNVQYLNQTVMIGSVVQEMDNTYYDDSEVVVVGQLNPNLEAQNSLTYDLRGSVHGMSQNGPVELTSILPVPCLDRCHSPVQPPAVCTDVLAENSTVPHFCGQFPSMAPCSLKCAEPVTPRSVLNLQPAATLGGFVERMWAYLTIKKYIRDSKFSDASAEQKSNLKEKALYLSLKYQFVTELTSMVVTKPGENETSIGEQVDHESTDYDIYYAPTHSGNWQLGKPGHIVTPVVAPDPPVVAIPDYVNYGPGHIYTPDSPVVAIPDHYIVNLNLAQKSRSTQILLDYDDFDNKGYKTSSDSVANIRPSSNYWNVTVSSVEDCVDECKHSTTCQSAVYVTESIETVETAVCALSFETVDCSTPTEESVSNSLPTLLYCFR